MTHTEIVYMCFFGELVPRTDELTIIATINTVTHQWTEFYWNNAFELDCQIRDAFSCIDQFIPDNRPQEDFIKNLKINVPENFNFGYDIVDAWAAEEPNKSALLWTNDKGEHVQFTFADMKHYTDITASYFQSLGIGRGDMVMLILKRRYEFLI